MCGRSAVKRCGTTPKYCRKYSSHSEGVGGRRKRGGGRGGCGALRYRERRPKELAGPRDGANRRAHPSLSAVLTRVFLGRPRQPWTTRHKAEGLRLTDGVAPGRGLDRPSEHGERACVRYGLAEHVTGYSATD